MDDVLDACISPHVGWFEAGRKEGVEAGASDKEPLLLGLEKGRDVGKELGFYRGACEYWNEWCQREDVQEDKRKVRVKTVVKQMLSTLDSMDLADPSKPELSDQIELVRAKYRQVCSVLGIHVEKQESELF